jgi:uncharacterized OsmC-like protein
MTLTRLEVVVDSESDDRGILGISEDVPSGPLSARVIVRIGAPDADPEAVRAMVDGAVAHSPVYDAVKRAIPVEVETHVN